MFQIGDVLGKGWEGFKAHAEVLIPAFIIATVVTLVVIIPLLVAEQATEDASSKAFLILIRIVLQTLLNALFQMGFITITLKIVRGKKPEIGDLFANFGKLVTGFLVVLLLTVVVTVGFFMLIVPGIIVAIMTFFSLWFVVDRDMGVMDSIKASYDATRGSLMNLFLFGLVGFALSVAGSIPCGLGLLIVVPVLSVASAHIYVALTKPEEESDGGEFANVAD